MTNGWRDLLYSKSKLKCKRVFESGKELNDHEKERCSVESSNTNQNVKAVSIRMEAEDHVKEANNVESSNQNPHSVISCDQCTLAYPNSK